MNATEVIRLVDERFDIVELLAELTQLQMDAICAGHMSALMHLLAQKQQPIDRLHELSNQLHLALSPSGAGPAWQSESQRSACRARNRLSEEKLAELLLKEAECERLLHAQREEIGNQLHHLNNSHRVANRYSQVSDLPTTGASLDLSSDN
jgi:adenylosuccinate synthase